MSHVYRERPEIPIPEEAHINHSDGRVYLMEASTRKRTVIGIATSENMMHPNDMYRKFYPEAWDPAFAKYNDPKGYEICVGMYGLSGTNVFDLSSSLQKIHSVFTVPDPNVVKRMKSSNLFACSTLTILL